MSNPTHHTSDGDSLVLTTDGEYVNIYSVGSSVYEPVICLALEDVRAALDLFDYENGEKQC